MKFIIEITYSTGDSFHNEEGCIETIDFNWHDEKIVDENVNRIKEHYEWYQQENERYRRNDEKVEKPKWLLPEIESDYGINFKLDSGMEQRFSCCWIGYFESLSSVEVKIEGKKIKF